MGGQYISDGYAVAAYIVSYISKSQTGMYNLLHKACVDARKGNLNLKQQVRQIGNIFNTCRNMCTRGSISYFADAIEIK